MILERCKIFEKYSVDHKVVAKSSSSIGSRATSKVWIKPAGIIEEFIIIIFVNDIIIFEQNRTNMEFVVEYGRQIFRYLSP